MIKTIKWIFVFPLLTLLFFVCYLFGIFSNEARKYLLDTITQSCTKIKYELEAKLEK